MGLLKKENINVNHRSHQSIRIENLKQYLLEIENIEENKWAKTGVYGCDRTIRNLLNEVGYVCVWL